MNTITEIEPYVRDYKAARDILTERVQRCQDEQLAIGRRLAPGIKSASAKTRDAKARLEEQIEANPQLFEKPKTQTIEGIKIGYRKGKGEVIITEKAIDLIRKHCPDLESELIKTTERVNKTAIANLPLNIIRKIGCNIIETGDQVVVSVPKENLDKLVDAMLQDAEI